MNVRRLLVDVDALAPAHPAVAQALAVASASGATVVLADVVPDVPDHVRRFVTPEVERSLVEERRRSLEEIARGAGGGRVETAVLRGRAAPALLAEVRRGGCDLLVRAHGRAPGSAGHPFGPVDMQLLRECPSPVWLVSADAPPRPARLLAAIHAAAHDDGERALNQRILAYALALRDPAGPPVTVLHAWEIFGEEFLRPRFSADEFAAILDAAQHEAAQALAAAVAAAGSTHLAPRLVKGAAEAVIPAVVGDERFDLVVMGTVGRTGVAGMVMGNTAERVLQRVRASVLAVTPGRA